MKQLSHETHQAVPLQSFIAASIGRGVIGACSPFPALRRTFAKVGITPAHFGNRAVRMQIPKSSKSFLMTGADTNHLTFQLFWGGTDYYEPFTRKVIETLTASAKVFIDVGANVGFFSLVAATVNPQLTLIAFEPNPSMFATLSANKRINDLSNLRVEPMAVSNVEGEAQLFLSPSDMSASLVPDFQKDLNPSPTSVSVRTTTLDSYVQQVGLQAPMVLKIDAEGHEKAVLQGAQRTISNLKPDLVIEVLGDFDPTLLRQYREQGYRFYKITNQGLLESEAVTLTKIGEFVFFNYLFTTRPLGEIYSLSEVLRQSATGINLFQTSKFAAHV